MVWVGGIKLDIIYVENWKKWDKIGFIRNMEERVGLGGVIFFNIERCNYV